MAHQTTLQFYRGELAGMPALEDGEPGWTTDTHQLFVGQDGTNREVGATGGGGAWSVTSGGSTIEIDESGDFTLTIAAGSTFIVGPSGGSWFQVDASGSVYLSASNSGIVQLYANGGFITIDAAGGIQITPQAGQVVSVGYTPAFPGDWVVAPTDLLLAVDRIARVVSGNGATPIP